MSARLRASLAIGLAAAATLAYRGVVRLGFVSDDQAYLISNRRLLDGFTADNLLWAFTSFENANWHPVTWLSHLLDVRLFGLAPAGHHGTSLVLHVLTTLLLFGVLRRLTGAAGRSAAVAALFALHPLRVESVAWVSERKDLLCGFFWVVALGAYLRWRARPGTARYLVLTGSFLLALLSKPMAVTFPFTLLLLDYWPLGRYVRRPALRTLSGLVREKLPLFALAAASSVATLLAQRAGGAMFAPPGYGPLVRAKGALVAYASYLGATLWPERLAFLYPLSPAGAAAGAALGAGALLLAVSAIALLRRRSSPALATGWFWFVGTLVPVIGLVQVGMQSHADRYTYVPHIGLFTALAWVAADLAARPAHRRLLVAACLVLVGALGLRTAAHVPVWRDDVSLFGHAVAVTDGNWLMHYRLARALKRSGRDAAALVQFQEALRFQPAHVEARLELAQALQDLGRYDEALAHYRQATIDAPAHPVAHKGLAALLELRGDLPEAIAHYRAAVRLDPGNAFFRALLERAIARRPAGE